MVYRIWGYIKSNWIIILILLVGAFFRLYKIDQYMTFLGDEGRDSIIVRNLLVYLDPILIGPGTSVGGMYLGPLYYYFMAPFLFFSNFSPVGPAIGVALLGVLAIYLIYVVASEWFSKSAGLVTAFLFAISPTVITFSHSSWNPNIMPFFALLSIYSIWKVYSENKFKWLIITAISFAFVLNSHYLGVLLAPVLILYWYLSKPKTYIRYTIYSLLVFGFLMSPLLIFDIRHNWMNSKALYKFLTVRQETVSIKPWTAIPKTYPIFEQINASMLTSKNETAGRMITVVFIVFMLSILLYSHQRKHQPYNILLLWLVSGLIGFGIYKQPIYDHYYGFMFPIPFLLFGALFYKVYNSKYKLLSVIVLLLLTYFSLSKNPFLNYPNNQMQRAENVANKVLEIADGKPFNLAVLAERNYEDGYRYFMDLAGAQVMHADRWDQKTIVDNLIVVCEKPKEKCDPTHSAKAEVANFGMSKIDGIWEIDGVIIFKLIHSI